MPFRLRVQRSKTGHQIIPSKRTIFWMIGWPGVGSCAERDLHCRAELLQTVWRRCHGRYHRAGVVLQVFDRSDSPERCKVQVLAKALESNDHVTHLNLEMCRIEVEGIKVGSLVWDPVSGVEVQGDELRLYSYQILPTLWIHSTYSSAVVARCLLDSG